MHIPSHHLQQGLDNSVAMTPMIDVVFLLLIFFVCAAAGSVQESVLATDLAPTGSVQSAVEPPELEPWEVEIRLRVERDAATGSTRFDMNGAGYDDIERLERQLAALAKIEPDNPVVLDVESGVAWGDVIDLYDRCRRNGLANISFAIDPADVAGQ